MRAMILAAGRGVRMRALTQATSKVLLPCGGRLLIEYAIHALATAGITEIVINVFYCAELIKQTLGNGERYGVKIFYSEERDRLETGGGIYQALPLLGSDPFIVVSADIITDYNFKQLKLQPNTLAHLIMVDNPPYRPRGDFGIHEQFASRVTQPFYTYANIGIYHPALFAACQPGFFKLFDVVNPAIDKRLVTADHYSGLWYNVGTPDDLASLEKKLSSASSHLSA